MGVERITLDTNILVYTFDADAGERHKKAVQVLKKVITLDCVLTLQALSEFFNTITRKFGLDAKIATHLVESFQEFFPVIIAKPTTLSHAMRLVCDSKLSFWDAMLCATARDNGVTLLLSEDFNHEQLLNSIRIVNPFLPNKFWNI